MFKAKIVIGCSYGDEGKGLAAAFVTSQTKGPCLNVLINGGAQRGHTVDLPDGRRHVFHHFGSGTLHGADSCADEDFIVNPLLFCQEFEELQAAFGLAPMLFVSEKCRVTTPWDMMLGQMIEENRGKARHGSCGCGLQETRLRYLHTDWALTYGQLLTMTRQDYQQYCQRIKQEYLPSRLAEMNMTVPSHWLPVLNNPDIDRATWTDLQFMLDNTRSYSCWAELADTYPELVFEAGQGLALDENNLQDFPHLTPSSTTSLTSAKRIAALARRRETEIIYVTRSYLTRHGAGPFPTECPKAEINPDMFDRTNFPNPHQETLRYGRFDRSAVLKRVQTDRACTQQILPGVKTALLVTHLNETNGGLTDGLPLEKLYAGFDRALYSYAPWEVREQPR